MLKLSFLIYLTLAFLFFFLISRNPSNSPNLRHPRLRLRSTFNFSHHHHHPVPFDPLLSDLELLREDKQWHKLYFHHPHPQSLNHAHQPSPALHSHPDFDHFMDAQHFFNDQHKFNLTTRLLLLFPEIDMDPVDGYVSEHELINWNLNQAEREAMHRTLREMDVHDKNHDGFISFAEYEPPSWVQHSDNDSFAYDMGWWREEHFNASDADGDGLLNITEFNDFLHPSDSKNPKLLQWLCQEEVRERDSDKDGKVNFSEFFHGVFELVRNYDEESHNSLHLSDESMEAPAQILFAQLDKDGDRYLSDIELLPIIWKLHPSEHYYAKQQADHIMSQADSDKDGRLSLMEMIDNPYVFYSGVFNDDEDDNYDFHDEFR